MKNIIVFILAITTLTSCNLRYEFGSVTGNGNVIKEERTITENFIAVKASNGLEVILVESNNQIVTIDADENLLEHIETYVSHGTLYIKTNKNIRRSSSKKIVVSYTSIEQIQSSSGAQIKGYSVIVSNNLSLKSSSGSHLEINALVKNLTAQASSGSEIKLSGQALKVDAKASSGSNIMANDLQAIHSIAKASSGSSIHIYVERTLDAKASSGAVIKYQGNPEQVIQNKSSSGSVSKI